MFRKKILQIKNNNFGIKTQIILNEIPLTTSPTSVCEKNKKGVFKKIVI